MSPASRVLACAAFASFALASPAAQILDFAALEAAPAVTSGPAPLAVAATEHTIDHTTLASITGVATALATGTPGAAPLKRGASAYTPYYAALRTGYTTDPALAATSTTTANQPCVTQPEAGTYCGFINPLDACSPQPDGYGPVPDQDTPSAFLSYTKLHSAAQAAPTTVPSTDYATYKQVFKDLNGAVTGGSYLGLYSLQQYDVAKCASYCDDTDLCTAFNVFAERDPSLRPANNDDDMPTVWGRYCPNPPSMTTFKCTLWGSSISADLATNTGQWQEQFQVVITASDGYDKTDSVTPPECSAPVTDTETPSATTSASTYVGSSTSSVAPYVSTSSVAPYVSTSSVAPYVSTSSAAPYVTTSSAAPYVTSSSSAAPYVTSSSSAAPYVTSSSSAAPYKTASSVAPYVTTSSAASYKPTSSAAPYVSTSAVPPPPPPPPGGNQPSYGQPAGGKPPGNQPSYGQPAGGNPPGNPPSNQPSYGWPFGWPFGNKPSDNQPSYGQPAGSKPPGNQPPYGQPSGSKPSDNQPSYGWPFGGKPPVSKPSDNQPSYGQPSGNKPSDNQPSYGKPPGSKPPGSSPKPPVYPWDKPRSCSGKAIEAPKYSMGSQFFPGPYNPQACSDYAILQNVANKKAGSKASCQMFNAFYLHKNGKPFGTSCNLFSADISPRSATFSTVKSPKGDKYECKQSWTYTLKK